MFMQETSLFFAFGVGAILVILLFMRSTNVKKDIPIGMPLLLLYLITVWVDLRLFVTLFLIVMYLKYNDKA